MVLAEPPESASDELIAMMEHDLLTQHHFGLFLEVARLLDISNRRCDAMMTVVKDDTRASLSRQFALLGLTSSRPQEEMLEVFEEVPPEIVAAVSDMPFVDMLTAIQLEPSLACDLTNVLLGAFREEQEFILLHHIGRIRREVGTPASLAYSHALAEDALEHLHPYMIESLIQERDSAGTALLTSLRDRARDDETRRRFQAALLRMGTLQIEDAPGRNAPDARAYVSICDGQGAYFLFCRYKMTDANWATASCCIRAASDIRDAFVLPQQSEEDFENMLARLTEQHLMYTEVPISRGAALFFDALDRTRDMGGRLPDSATPVVSLFERIVPDFTQDALPSSSVSVAALHELLDMPRFDSWFFDEGDLAGHGIASPSGSPSSAWYREAAAIIENTPLKLRLLSMLGHMTRWHVWAGELDAAALLSAAREQAVSNFKKSAMVRVMLERSLYENEEEAGAAFDDLMDELSSEDGLYGSEELRGTLRRRFFNELKRPSGRHLAELDFMEMAYHQLHLAFSGVPGEKRPREDDVLDLCYAVAREFVRSLLNGRDAALMIEKIDKIVADRCDLTGGERTDLIHIVVDGLFNFIDSACRQCKVQCLDAPRKGMADHFFSSVHPATH